MIIVIELSESQMDTAMKLGTIIHTAITNGASKVEVYSKYPLEPTSYKDTQQHIYPDP